MRATLVVPVAIVSTLALFYIKETCAIKCFVCQGCGESFASSDLQNCSRTQDKCIKMQLMSGEIDRMCADKNKCDGRGKGRSKRSIEEEIEASLPKKRVVRQLLGGGDSGGSSSNNANKNKNKNKEKPKEENPGTKHASEIHCCAEDECNGAVRLSSSSPYSPLLVICLLFITISSSLAFPQSSQHFRLVGH